MRILWERKRRKSLEERIKISQETEIEKLFQWKRRESLISFHLSFFIFILFYSNFMCIFKNISKSSKVNKKQLQDLSIIVYWSQKKGGKKRSKSCVYFCDDDGTKQRDEETNEGNWEISWEFLQFPQVSFHHKKRNLFLFQKKKKLWKIEGRRNLVLLKKFSISNPIFIFFRFSHRKEISTLRNWNVLQQFKNRYFEDWLHFLLFQLLFYSKKYINSRMSDWKLMIFGNIRCDFQNNIECLWNIS